MALRAPKPEPSPRTQPACRHEALIAALRQQIVTLEQERDEARQGLLLLEQALRRQGCCEAAAKPVP